MQAQFKHDIILIAYIAMLALGTVTSHAAEVIVVQAERRPPLAETRVPVEVIDRAEIELRGGRNLVDILAGIAGIQVTPGIRGFRVMLQGTVCRSLAADERRLLSRSGFSSSSSDTADDQASFWYGL